MSKKGDWGRGHVTKFFSSLKIFVYFNWLSIYLLCERIFYYITQFYKNILRLFEIFKTMKNIVQEISVLTKSHVHIKNPEKLNETLHNMAQGGVSKLQVVSDFDRTITKQHINGVPHLSSFAMFSRLPSTSKNERYQHTVKGLRQKYYPIEIDPYMPLEEKVKYMEEWWSLSEQAISGLAIPQQEIDDCCLEFKPTLRDGSQEFFMDIANEKIPVLVFSAGCGNIVTSVLKHCGVLLPNVKVVANFLKYNDQGVVEGFQDKIIHVFNKNEYAIKDSDFYDNIVERENVILMGDSLGDAHMTQGMDHLKNILKIGFLYDHVDLVLPEYMDTFDIVLVDDQTMEVPKAIFDYIKNGIISD